VVEGERLRREAAGEGLAEQAAHDARLPAGGELQLEVVDAHPRADVDEAVGMVAVMVREDDFGDAGRRQSRPGEGAGQLLLYRDVEAREGDVARRRGLAA